MRAPELSWPRNGPALGSIPRTFAPLTGGRAARASVSIPCVPGDAQAKALDLLTRRPHFRRELAQKLGQRGFPPDEVEPLLDRLEDLGYLDDARCAAEMVRGPLARKGYGPRRMRAELARRGAADEVVDESLAVAFPEGESEAARQVAERFLRTRKPDPAALARHLDRKGYSQGVVLELLESFEPPGAEPDGE